ncbi:MAG: hypothetical protein ACRDPJ_13805 [Nocardioidaceae bacterium]
MQAEPSPATSTTLTAAVMGHVLALVDRATLAVPVDTERHPAAAVIDDVLVLRCGGSYMHALLLLQRFAADPGQTSAPIGAVGEREHVTLEWRLPSGRLVVNELHGGSIRVPDLGLTAGPWTADVDVWGRQEAADYEIELDEMDEELPGSAPDSPLGPEIWRIRLWPSS